jgi:hypothetical protein
MQSASGGTPEGELPPPGRRWGAGAQSVLPYLTRSLQARPSAAQEGRESRPGDGHPVLRNWPARPIVR